MLAKADFQPLHFHRTHLPIRWQARSYNGNAGLNGLAPGTEPVGASLLAKADFQPLHLHRTHLPIRGQARSYKGNAGLTGLAPGTEPVGASLLAKRPAELPQR